MKTRSKAKSRILRASSDAGAGDPTTLSVRLTPQERQLLADAAALRGWTPTNLLRVAAIERAAQILNTSKPTKLDFAQAAKQVAALLCGPRDLEIRREVDRRLNEDDPQCGSYPPWERVPWSDEDAEYRATPRTLSAGEVQSLREAVRKGGPDFLAQVLAECARLQGPTATAQDLPDPIDPDSFS